MKSNSTFLSVKSLFLTLTFILSCFVTYSQCPVIQFQDLRGVIGFPQFDNTSQCGDADTLSVLIFTDAPGEILGFDLTVNLESGLVYGGFEETDYGGNTSIAYAGGPPNNPEFSLGGVTDPDNVFVANIGLRPDCELDLEGTTYFIGFDYEYTFEEM